MGNFLSSITACSGSPSHEAVADEGIALPFPKTDQYSDVNEEIQYLFNHYVSLEPRQPNQGLFRIDGNVNEDEIHLWRASLDIWLAILKRVPPQKIKQDQQNLGWTDDDTNRCLVALASLNQFLIEIMKRELERIHQREPATAEEMPEKLRSVFVFLSQVLGIYARPDEKVVLSYCVAEAKEAPRQNRPLSFMPLRPVFSNHNLSEGDDFKEFLFDQTPGIAEAVESFNGNVVDWIDSGAAKNPLLVVFLDIHNDVELNISNLHDAAILRHFDPVVGVEGIEFNVVPYSTSLKKEARGAYQRSMDLAREYGAQMVLSLASAGNDEESFEVHRRTNKEYQKLSELHDHYNKEAHIMGQWLGLVMAREDDELSFADKEEILVDRTLFLAIADEQTHTFDFGAQWLYPEMDVRGYEYYDHKRYEDDYVEEIDELYFRNLLYGFNTILRSHVSLDNMLEMMAQQGTPLGVMSIGEAHYLSLKDYARERGGVNVVFVQPLPDAGDLPR